MELASWDCINKDRISVLMPVEPPVKGEADCAVGLELSVDVLWLSSTVARLFCEASCCCSNKVICCCDVVLLDTELVMRITPSEG